LRGINSGNDSLTYDHRRAGRTRRHSCACPSPNHLLAAFRTSASNNPSVIDESLRRSYPDIPVHPAHSPRPAAGQKRHSFPIGSVHRKTIDRPGAQKIEGTVVGELPIRKDLRLLTEEGYSVKFYLRDTFGSVVILDPILDSSGNLSSRRYSLSDGLHLAESIICRSRFAPKRSVGNPYSCRC
jgi:hypothetical protein